MIFLILSRHSSSCGFVAFHAMQALRILGRLQCVREVQCPQTIRRILWVPNLALFQPRSLAMRVPLLLCPLPAFDPHLEFQKRAPSRRNDRAQKVSFSSSCRRIISLPQSPPCLQRILPRVGDNVIRLITRESHECCVHSRFCTPLSSFVSVGKNSRSIALVVISVGCSAAHSNIISDSLISPAKNASVFFDHCCKSSFTFSKLLRTTNAFHIDETRSVFPNLSCRKIVDCSHCIGKSRFCCH